LFGPPGYEINLLYIAGLVALALSGPTALSIDRVLAPEKQVHHRGNRNIRLDRARSS
jgi:putative oxidoreductase